MGEQAIKVFEVNGLKHITKRYNITAMPIKSQANEK